MQEAKELLYRLFKAGFVGLQDVPRTADHAPSRTLYTWSVNNEAAADKLAAELYKAAFNVYVRCTHEFEQHKEVSVLCDASVHNSGPAYAYMIQAHVMATCLPGAGLFPVEIHAYIAS